MLAPLLLLLAASDGTSSPAPIRVDAQEFNCLVRNVESLTRHSKPIIVDISQCPPVIRRNYTSWPTTRIDPVIRLTVEQLKCIKDNRTNIGRIANVLDNGVYELRFERCRAR